MQAEKIDNSNGSRSEAMSAVKPVLFAVAITIAVTFAFSLALRFPMLLQGSDAYAFWPTAAHVTFESSLENIDSTKAEKTLLLLGNTV